MGLVLPKLGESSLHGGPLKANGTLDLDRRDSTLSQPFINGPDAHTAFTCDFGFKEESRRRINGL
jgi:hypothetical protein